MRERGSGIVTRWPVLQEHPVTSEDLDDTGRTRDEAVERWMSVARLAYIDRCPALRAVRERRELDLRFRATSTPRAVLGRPTDVVVTAHVTEIMPSSLVMAVRIRPIGGSDNRTLDATWVVAVVDRASGQVRTIGEEMRGDLIALERSAEYYS